MWNLSIPLFWLKKENSLHVRQQQHLDFKWTQGKKCFHAFSVKIETLIEILKDKGILADIKITFV